MTAQPSTKRRLTRQDWTDAAIELLAEAGIAAVSVDRLATNLGITRGSFYHHFADREDLLSSILEYWAQRWTYDICDRVEALGLDPSNALLALIKMVRHEGAAERDAPFRAWALHDPLARGVVEQVDRARMDIIHSQFEALGFTGLDAENRARLCLFYQAAAPSMFVDRSQESDERLLMERHRFLTTARIE
jgi:AcrR family transcriptional regulator